MTPSFIWVHLVVAGIAQADQVAVIHRQVWPVFKMFDMMNCLSFRAFAVSFTVLAEIAIPSEDRFSFLFPLFGLVEFFTFHSFQKWLVVCAAPPAGGEAGRSHRLIVAVRKGRE